MKQKFFYLGIVLLAGIFSFISCSKNDDDSDNTDDGNEFYEKGVATVEGDVVVYKSGHSIIKYYFEGDKIVKMEATINYLTEEAANNMHQKYLTSLTNSTDSDAKYSFANLLAEYFDLKRNGKYLIGTDNSSIDDVYRGFTKEQVANLLNTVPLHTLNRSNYNDCKYTYDCNDSSIAKTLYNIYLENLIMKM